MSLYNVTFRFSDGVERRVLVAEGATILDAALAEDIAILNQCRSGSCTSCAARLIAGKAEMRASSSSLLAAEKSGGQRLLCMTEARGDCTFALPYESSAASAVTRAHAFVDTVERIAEDVVRLRLELAEGSWLDFKPGQFVQVKVPGTDQLRSYSMASSPGDLPSIELLVRLLPSGAMSNWLRDRAKIDDVVEIEGAFGAFFLRDKFRAQHIMIAGGTGLAPMMSMIDAIRARPGRKPPVLLAFGCATREGLFHREALDLRRLWLPSLETRICIDRGQPCGEVRVGNPVAAVAEGTDLDPGSVAYLCGPPGMVAAAREMLQARGLAPDNIFAEKFVASG